MDVRVVCETHDCSSIVRQKFYVVMDERFFLFFLNTKPPVLCGGNKTVSCPESRRFSNSRIFRFEHSRRYCRDHAVCVCGILRQPLPPI